MDKPPCANRHGQSNRWTIGDVYFYAMSSKDNRD
jgi:hypothetical protein